MNDPEQTAKAEDLALLEAWRNGDRIAGNELVRRHFGAVFRFFRSKRVNAVDDLAHQTFAVALEGAHRGSIRSSFRAYLLGIARHQLFRLFRSREREARALALHRMSVDELTGTPSGILAARDELELLAAALQAIPLDLQIVVELYYWESMRVAEIAEVVEVPPGTVKSRLARAREQLRGAIEAASALPAPLRRTTLDGLEAHARALGRRLTPP